MGNSPTTDSSSKTKSSSGQTIKAPSVEPNEEDIDYDNPRGGHLGYFPAGTSKIRVILNTGFSEK